MTTRRASTASKKKPTTAVSGRKPAAKPRTAKTTSKRARSARKPTPPIAARRSGTLSKDLLHAGFSALSLPKAESAMADGLSRIASSFGLKKLEDVFDQRVAAALERLGFPSAEELTRLVDLVERLSAQTKPPRK